MSGWVKLHRKILEWEWYDDLPVRVLFLHLLVTANYKPTRWRGRLIERGQRLISVRDLAEESGLSHQQTRTAINKLLSTHEITHEATHTTSVITVCKYETYQLVEEHSNTHSNTQGNTRATHEQHTSNTPTRKEGEEGKKEKKERTTPQTPQGGEDAESENQSKRGKAHHDLPDGIGGNAGQPNPNEVSAWLMARWNGVEGVQALRVWSTNRKRQLGARLQEDEWREMLPEGMRLLSSSAFLRGENDRGWQADIDWFLRPGSLAKLVEGKYHDTKRGDGLDRVDGVLAQNVGEDWA